MKAATPCLLLVALVASGCPYESHVDPAEPPMAADAGPLRRVGPEGPEYAEHPDPAVQATIAAWRERYFVQGDVGSPDYIPCVDTFARLEVVSAAGEEFRRLCSRCDPDDPSPECAELGRTDSCAPLADVGADDEPRPLNVVASAFAPGTRAHRHLVIHETIHHLGRCTGDGLDAAHGRPELWCTGGDLCDEDEARRSITSRARVLATDDDE